MELIKDFDCMIDYHPGKANVVADALSRIQTLRALNAHLSLSDDGTVMAELIARPSLLNQVLEAQKKDEKISTVINQIGNGKETEFTVDENGVLYYKYRVCVPDDNDLRKSILEEVHSGSFAIDELKSHSFSVHFFDLFLSKKTDLYAEIWNNSPNYYAAGNSRERGIFAVEGAEGG